MLSHPFMRAASIPILVLVSSKLHRYEAVLEQFREGCNNQVDCIYRVDKFKDQSYHTSTVLKRAWPLAHAESDDSSEISSSNTFLNQDVTDVLIVKYGGSAITEKQRFENLNEESLIATAEHIAEVRRLLPNTQIVIVHGAGSFGHFQAKKYGIKQGRKPAGSTRSIQIESTDSESEWRYGFSLTRKSVLELNRHVVNAHIEQRLPAVSVSLFPTLVSTSSSSSLSSENSKTIHRRESLIPPLSSNGTLSYIDRLLGDGLLPVVHGDAVLDDAQTYNIFGGDQVVLWLCKMFANKQVAPQQSYKSQQSPQRKVRVVFLTDVAGVYDKAPHLADAQLIPLIFVDQSGTMNVAAETEHATHDVTGGIQAKLETAAEIARMGIEVHIVQVGTSHALHSLLGRPAGASSRTSTIIDSGARTILTRKPCS